MAVFKEKGCCWASGVRHVVGKIHFNLLDAAVKMRRAGESPIRNGAGLDIALKDSLGRLIAGRIVLLKGVRVAVGGCGQALHNTLEMRGCLCGHCTTPGGHL